MGGRTGHDSGELPGSVGHVRGWARLSFGTPSLTELCICRSQYENSDQFQYANGPDGVR